MKLTFGEKTKLFWERNRGVILELIVLAVTGTAIGSGIAIAVNKKEKRKQEERQKYEEMLKEQVEAQQLAYEAEEERIMNAPENQLPGGGFVRDNYLYEPDCPGCLCNCVSLTAMGEFGQDMIRRLKDEYPDWEQIGMFDPETAVADVIMDFCHAKWLAAHPDEKD